MHATHGFNVQWVQGGREGRRGEGRLTLIDLYGCSAVELLLLLKFLGKRRGFAFIHCTIPGVLSWRQCYVSRVLREDLWSGYNF
jgi:hypothetical protein